MESARAGSDAPASSPGDAELRAGPARRRPQRWRGRRVARKWRYRLAPDPLLRRPKGALPFWARVRRVFWSWWPWLTACLYSLVTDRWGWAIGTGAMAFVAYIITPAESPPRYGLDHEFSTEDEEFVASMEGATGVACSEGNCLDVLNNGDAFYPAMLDAIQAAELSITIEAYIYWAGEIGRRFAEALAAKSRDGVRVKILLDAVGASSIGEEILRILEGGRCQLAWYNPMFWRRIGRYNHRTHRKSLIIDGRVGFTGGAGIADHWKGNARNPREWRDTMIRMEGPAVSALQTGFGQNWLQTTGELISGPIYYPPHDANGALKLQTIMSSPEIGASSVRIMYYLSIICARESIFIANPYFVPDAAAIEALLDARRRGVDVRVMVSGTYNDNWLARQNSVRLYGPLLRAGIRIFDYNHTMLHHKTMVVDGRWSTVGTTNFDNRSFSHNEESNVCCYDERLAAHLNQAFEVDMTGCMEVTYDMWKRRGILRRIGEVLASFVEEQI
jgi:cardiolipin synthase